jgi:hypothetical protein
MRSRTPDSVSLAGQSHLEFHSQWSQSSRAIGIEGHGGRGETNTLRTAEITTLVHPDGISGGLAVKINRIEVERWISLVTLFSNAIALDAVSFAAGSIR